MVVFMLSQLGMVLMAGGIGLAGKWIDYRKAAASKPKQVITYLPDSCFYNPPAVGEVFYLKTPERKSFEVVDERRQINR